MLSHITNTAYQAVDPNFTEQDCVLLWDEDVPSILVKDGTCAGLAEARRKVQSVLDDMRIITGEVFTAYKNEYGVFAPIEGCFEQFGLDFIVDDHWNVYLLEINPGPDFKQTGERLSRVIEKFMGDTIDVALLDHVDDCCHDADVDGQRSMKAHGNDHGPEYACALTLVYQHQIRSRSLLENLKDMKKKSSTDTRIT